MPVLDNPDKDMVARQLRQLANQVQKGEIVVDTMRFVNSYKRTREHCGSMTLSFKIQKGDSNDRT